MGRYFFHLEVNGKSLTDSEGAALASVEQAKDGAVRALRALARDMGLNGELTVRDAEGRVIHLETVHGERRQALRSNQATFLPATAKVSDLRSIDEVYAASPDQNRAGD